MSDTTEVEAELMKVTKYRPKRNASRQDFLGGLIRAINEVPEESFNELSDEAADWYDNGAKAVNRGEDIPDFEEPEEDSDDEADEADEAEDEPEAEDDNEASDADEDDGAEEADEAEDEDEDSDESEESESGDSDDASADEDDGEGDAGDGDDSDAGDDEDVEPVVQQKLPAAKPKKGAEAKAPVKGGGKSAKGAKGERASPARDTDDEPEAQAPVKKLKGAQKAPVPKTKQQAKLAKALEEETVRAVEKQKREQKKPRPGDKRLPSDSISPELTGRKNRYGYYEGTKLDAACVMFEKGAAMKDARDYFNDSFYNLHKNLREQGHIVEKREDGKFYLTYVDADGKKPKAEAAPKKAAKKK